MSFNYSPKIVNDSSLVLYLDAANPKSMPGYTPSNLLLNSGYFNLSPWQTGGATITPNAGIAPDGTNTAYLYNDTGASGTLGVITQAFTVTSNILTCSIYLKASAITINRRLELRNDTTLTDFDVLNINLNTGVFTGVGWTVITLPNGWYRCIYTRSTGFTIGNSMRFYTARTSAAPVGATDQWFAWGAQVVPYPQVTSYIQTTSTTISGSTLIWNDISRGGNNGTLTNNPTYDYSNGGGITLTNALNATGSSVTQRVIVPNSSSIQFTTGMSADIWFYANGSTQPSTLPRLLEKGDFYLLIFQTLPSNLTFNVSSIAGGRSITSINSPITNTTRINVTTTYDGQISKIYINGVLNNTTDWGSISPISPTSTDLSIGDNFGWSRTFNGTIYSTKLYNRALSAAEVLQNYNAIKSRFGL